MDEIKIKVVIEDGEITGVFTNTEHPISVEFIDINDDFGSESEEGVVTAEKMQADGFHELDQFVVTHYSNSEEEVE